MSRTIYLFTLKLLFFLLFIYNFLIINATCNGSDSSIWCITIHIVEWKMWQVEPPCRIFFKIDLKYFSFFHLVWLIFLLLNIKNWTSVAFSIQIDLNLSPISISIKSFSNHGWKNSTISYGTKIFQSDGDLFISIKSTICIKCQKITVFCVNVSILHWWNIIFII